MVQHLPLSDPFILASCINTLLRDGEFDDLESLCAYFEVEEYEVNSILQSAGFHYIPEFNTIK